MLIDSHIHVGQFFNRYHSPENVINLMNSCGVDYYLVSSTSICLEDYWHAISELDKCVDLSGGKAQPVLWITLKMLEENMLSIFLNTSINWKCVKLHTELNPEDWPAHSEQVTDVIDIARGLGVPLLIHTGESDYSVAHKYEKEIADNSDINFILAHGRPIASAIRMAKEHYNVYIDTAFMPVNDIVRVISNGLQNRILWGSDYLIPAHYYKDIRLIEHYINMIIKLQQSISLEDFESLTYKNSAVLFGIN